MTLAGIILLTLIWLSAIAVVAFNFGEMSK
jgi:hypothetical protein